MTAGGTSGNKGILDHFRVGNVLPCCGRRGPVSLKKLIIFCNKPFSFIFVDGSKSATHKGRTRVSHPVYSIHDKLKMQI